MRQYILFADLSQKTFILDIPCSLEQANNDSGQLSILSSTPPSDPYKTPEAKGRKRDALEAAIPSDKKRYHDELQSAIQKELTLLHNSNGSTVWSLPRVVEDATGIEAYTPVAEPSEREVLPPIVLSRPNNHFPSCLDIQNVLVTNSSNEPTSILITDGHAFNIPSRSTLIWSTIQQAAFVLAQSRPCHGIDLKFDIILMDPPWPNRSVRNARAYCTADAQETDPFRQAMKIGVHHLNQQGFIAVWITNKWRIYQNVVACMAGNNLALVEQWVWTKTTTKGEPITPLSGLWRKPYEVLLIFRHCLDSPLVLQRYIFAVPDLHSRKPNLKSIFETLFGPRKVLELFARNLTAGWTSIGDEVLKFQNKELWLLREDASTHDGESCGVDSHES